MSSTDPGVPHGQFHLLGERRFAPLFWTQFLGAANDNLLKFRRGVLSRIGLEAAPAVAPSGATPEALQATVLALRGDWR